MHPTAAIYRRIKRGRAAPDCNLSNQVGSPNELPENAPSGSEFIAIDGIALHLFEEGLDRGIEELAVSRIAGGARRVAPKGRYGF